MMFERIWLLALAPVIALAIGGLAWWARRRRLRAAAGWSRSFGELAAGHGGDGGSALGHCGP